MRRLIALLVLLSAFTTSLSVNQQPPDLLEQMIGQMIMVGFRGIEPDPRNPIVTDISEGRIGGVVLFDVDGPGGGGERNIRSPEQLRRLTSWLEEKAGSLPLLVAIDQEGGKVNRLKVKYGFPPTVSARELGDRDDVERTSQVADRVAATLVAEGINLNFAPVVDLNTNPENPVIGSKNRSFSADPTIVVRQAQAWFDAHRRAGVISTLKHFPGHGSSRADSHRGFVDVTKTWDQRELIPYGSMIAGGFSDAVMTAHIFNARLDPDYPATLSRATITGILRNQLGFQGVVISDDMQMKAISEHYGLEESIRLGLDAGLDIFLFANNSAFDPDIARKICGIIRRLVDEGTISRARIEASYGRICRLKARIGRVVRPETPNDRAHR